MVGSFFRHLLYGRRKDLLSYTYSEVLNIGEKSGEVGMVMSEVESEEPVENFDRFN